MKIIVLALLSAIAISLPLGVYYYSPGQSMLADDVQHNTTLIIVAFANIQNDGTVVLPSTLIPCTAIAGWRQLGKKVFFSIGGQDATWTNIFASNASMTRAINSILQILNTSPFQGVDLDIQDYTTSPYTVATFIKVLKQTIQGYYISVTPQCVGVYQGQPVPTNTSFTAGQYWNYWVPILNIAIGSIDLVQVQAYNNWYDGLPGGTLNYLADVTLQWLNRASSYCSGCSLIPNFSGVPPKKLSIGVLASPSAGGAGYYASPPVLQSYFAWLSQQSISIAGMFLWDSHWDSLNNFAVSNTITQGVQGTPLTPTPDTSPNVCGLPKTIQQALLPALSMSKKKIIQKAK